MTEERHHLTPVRDDGPDPRTPPNDLRAERALLGLCLTTPHLIPELDLQPDAFYQPRHEWLYQHLTALHDKATAAGDALTPITVNATLIQTHPGEYVRNGAGEYLFDLVQAATGETPATAQFLARLIREKHRARRVIELGRRFTQLGHAADNTGLDQALMDATDELEVLLRHQLFGTPTDQSVDGITYLPISGLFTRERHPTPWHIAPLIAAGRVTLLYSPGKTGKSLIAMEAAAALASGRGALATRGPNEPLHVLYVDQEMTADDWQDRLTDMGYDQRDEAKLDLYLHLAQLQNWPAMDTPAGGRALHREALRVGAQVVIIDTVSKVTSGEENSNDTAQAFYRNTLVALKRDGIGVLILDHTGKDIERGARGGSAKTDNIDLAFELLLRGRDLLTMRCSHARFRDDLLTEPTFLRRQTAPLTHLVEDTPTSRTHGPGIRPTHLMEKVSRYVELNPGATRTVIETAKLGKTDYVRMSIDLLVMEGYIRTESGPRKAVCHHHVQPYREAEDTHA